MRGAFYGQFVNWCFCFRLWSRPERTLTLFLLTPIFYLRCTYNTCHIVSIYHAIYRIDISCDISHDIGIEISRTYSRYWYRYIPKISHDISRILDMIPSTSSKQFQTHTWRYASLPPSWLYTAHTTAVVPIVVGFHNPQHPEPAEST